MKTTNDNFTGSKMIASTISALMLATSLSGCASRDEKFEKHLSPWIDNVPTQCATLGEDSDLTMAPESATKERLKNMGSLWEKTPEGSIWKNYVANEDIAFCFGKAVSEGSPIAISPKVDAYLLDENITDEQAARSILTQNVLKQYNNAVEWSEQYKPADAVLWSRAMKGHKINIELSQAYQMADNNFDKAVWRDVENNSYIKSQAEFFRDIVEQGYSTEQAHSAVLEDYLGDTQKHESDDRTFLKWYDKHLHKRTKLTASFCLGFDGKMSPCMKTVTVVPDETVASSDISYNALGKLSGAYTASSYLNDSRASDLINNESNYDMSNDNISQFAQVTKNAEKCCGENRMKGGSSTLGLTFGGKIGLAF